MLAQPWDQEHDGLERAVCCSPTRSVRSKVSKTVVHQHDPAIRGDRCGEISTCALVGSCTAIPEPPVLRIDIPVVDRIMAGTNLRISTRGSRHPSIPLSERWAKGDRLAYAALGQQLSGRQHLPLDGLPVETEQGSMRPGVIADLVTKSHQFRRQARIILDVLPAHEEGRRNPFVSQVVPKLLSAWARPMTSRYARAIIKGQCQTPTWEHTGTSTDACIEHT